MPSTRNQVVELFGRLRKMGERRAKSGQRSRARMTIEFKAPEIYFDGRHEPIARKVAQVIALSIKTSMLTGLSPAGGPLPGVSAATAKRRRQRLAQGARGGEAHERFVTPRVRARIKKRFLKRYRAPRLGYFKPSGRFGGNAWWGVESGMLASSALAEPTKDGAWRVFFANPRGVVERGGGSAVKRVFAKIRPWSEEAMRQPGIQRALEELKRDLIKFRRNELFKNLATAASAAAQTAESYAEEYSTEE